MSKVISVWGSPNSGKTTFSIKLARELAKKNTVMLVFSDILCPTIPSLIKDADSKKSLGNVLSAPILTEEDILLNSLTIKNNKNLAFIGYARRENVFNYPTYNTSRAREFINNLKKIVDYVVIDLSTNFVNDVLATTSLEISDEVIRLSTPYLKDIEFYNSYLPLLSESRFQMNTHINILSNFMENDAVAELSEYYNVIEKFPFVEEIREQSLTGELFNALSMRNEQRLKERLQNIINYIDENFEVMEEEEDYFEEKSIKDKIFGSFKSLRRKEV